MGQSMNHRYLSYSIIQWIIIFSFVSLLVLEQISLVVSFNLARSKIHHHKQHSFCYLNHCHHHSTTTTTQNHFLIHPTSSLRIPARKLSTTILQSTLPKTTTTTTTTKIVSEQRLDSSNVNNDPKFLHRWWYYFWCFCLEWKKRSIHSIQSKTFPWWNEKLNQQQNDVLCNNQNSNNNNNNSQNNNIDVNNISRIRIQSSDISVSSSNSNSKIRSTKNPSIHSVWLRTVLDKCSPVIPKVLVSALFVVTLFFHTIAFAATTTGGRVGGGSFSRSSNSRPTLSRPSSRQSSSSSSSPTLGRYHFTNPTTTSIKFIPFSLTSSSSPQKVVVIRQFSGTNLYHPPSSLGTNLRNIALLTGAGGLIFYGLRNNVYQRSNDFMDRTNEFGNSSEGATVASVTVAMNVPNKSDPDSMISKLRRVAETSNTSSQRGLKDLVTGVILELIRRESSIVSTIVVAKYYPKLGQAEREFQLLSIKGQSKVDDLTVNKFGSDYRNDIRVRTSDKSASNGPTMAVVTLTIGLEGNFVGNKPVQISNRQQLLDFLTQVGSDVQMEGNTLLSAEVIWSPEDPSDVLTKEDIYSKYPELRTI